MIETLEFRRAAGSAGLIGLTAFIGAVIGFVLQLLVAYHFGAGTETDAYFMALSTSELLSKLLMGGSITSVFIPVFVERLTTGRSDDAWRLSLNIFHLMGAVYLMAVVILAIFAEPFAKIIAPGFDQQTFSLTVSLLRVLLPSFFFLFMVDLATSILHSLKKFALPAMLRIIAPAVSIICIILFVRLTGIYSLAIGAVVGSIIQVLFLTAGLRRQGMAYKFIFSFTDPQIKRLLYLVYPFIFSALVTQGAGLVYRVLVSELSSGSLASLKFAEKITQLLIIMFLNSITLVIYPLLAEKASRHDMAGIRQTIGSAIRLIFFITVPLVIGVTLLRGPLVSFLYQRGSFTPEDASMTAVALLYLIIGMTTNGISAVLGYTVLALKETRASVAVTICSQAIAIALFVLLVPSMGHAGLALASSLVPISAALLYFIYLGRWVPDLKNVFLHKTYIKTIISGALLAILLLALRPLLSGLANGQLTALVQVLVPATIGSVFYFGAAYIWRIHEMRELMAILRHKMEKWGFSKI